MSAAESSFSSTGTPDIIDIKNILNEVKPIWVHFFLLFSTFSIFHFIFFIVAPLLVIILFFQLPKYIKFVKLDEQLKIEGVTSSTIINGPTIKLLIPFVHTSSEIIKAKSLGQNEYYVIKDVLTGEKRIELGPKLLFLNCYDRIIDNKRKALSLKANEFVRLLDHSTGKVRVLQGEKGCIVPNPEETLMDGEKLEALDLKIFEYVKIQDKKTGTVRTVKGETVVFLGPFEEFLGPKQQAYDIDEETAVLVRNKRSGQQHLFTEKQLFIPKEDEDVLEVRKLTQLADYEACIVRDKDGKDNYYFGKNDDQRSFFLSPYCAIVPLLWSRGRKRERRDLAISKIDLRPMYMSFEFNCRTNDNVSLVLEGSFFWEVVDLESMARFTNDTTGDICNHARSGFIEKVSKVTLQEFMTKFNKIAEEVHRDDNSNFYEQRGVKIHSLEVTGYRCAENSTAMILEQIIQETTNRMNRLSKQESENEVQLNEIRGDIEEEKSRAELIAIQTENSTALAQSDGMAEAARVKVFLSEISKDFPDIKIETAISLWSTLRKEDALKAISNGNARVYFTPKDANISIQNHDHDRIHDRIHDGGD